MRSLSSVNDEPFTSAAEIGVYTDKVKLTKMVVVDKICFAMYTTQNDVLKMTAQLYPGTVGTDEDVVLEINEKGKWKQVDRTNAVLPGYSAIFRVEKWDMSKDVAYRVVAGHDSYEGIVRHNPVEKDMIVAAVFTGNGSGRISKQDIVDNINKPNMNVIRGKGRNHCKADGRVPQKRQFDAKGLVPIF